MAARLGSASGPLPWPEVFLLDDPQITELPEPAVMRPMGHSFASGGGSNEFELTVGRGKVVRTMSGTGRLDPGLERAPRRRSGAGQPRLHSRRS